MFGILSYVIAELASMSGVITVLVCGVALAHLNFYNLSITGQISTGYIYFIMLELHFKLSHLLQKHWFLSILDFHLLHMFINNQSHMVLLD
jgi:NhaP-type Na+/H+ or K+/H+ antiporter